MKGVSDVDEVEFESLRSREKCCNLREGTLKKAYSRGMKLSFLSHR